MSWQIRVVSYSMDRRFPYITFAKLNNPTTALLSASSEPRGSGSKPLPHLFICFVNPILG
jgi:hypothetical protein